MLKWFKVMILTLLCTLITATGVYAMQGNGTETDSFQIVTVQDLNTVQYDLNSHYKLMNNIDLAWMDFNPIGNTSNPFNGYFDGNGYAIRNLNTGNGAYLACLASALVRSAIYPLKMLISAATAIAAQAD